MSQPPKVMIVEDELIYGKFIMRLLSAKGYQVFGPFETCEPALSFLENENIDAAILDITLRSGENSFAIADKLRQSGIPFFFLSGGGVDRSEDVVKTNNIFVEKPASARKVLETLSELLSDR